MRQPSGRWGRWMLAMARRRMRCKGFDVSTQRRGPPCLALIAMRWLTPLWIALWLTVTNPADIVFEFATRGALLVFTPFFFVLWAAMSIIPYKLVLRIREISSRA
ncbi:hypothetical protein IP81_06770 [Novosphingobium sp. AAP83]|nr:hypothetical protein IP81_06770 [Novosphingobium sp. AAP83]